jgi:DNA primase
LIPESFIQELLARVDIVDVVERYLPLRKSGANYSACCPFHSEKTPSFTVSASKQFYHCFGCGAHGSAIGFVMQYSGLGFIDAVEELARGVGLTVPRQERVRAETERKAPLTEIMGLAAKFYREQLKTSPKAIDYLRGRGLSGEIAARFGLGYAPDGWQSLDQVFSNYRDPALAECGLVIDNEQGRRYDRFRDRIMFPILDQRGNVIGFGGRVIGQGEPKYLNSPETPLFEKGRELYGLVQARRAIHDVDTAIVVEGYMDVVGLAQLGVENAVAALGTATTGMHVQKLLKQANRVVFCFDRDSAGDKAAWRAVEASLEHLVDNKTVEILQMPGDQDPDEYIREHGRDQFMRLASNATKLSEFFVRELAKRTSPYTAEGRAAFLHEAKPLLQRISAPVLRVQLTKAVADIVQLSQAEVEGQCGLKPLARRSAYYSRSQQRPPAQSTEFKLLEILLLHPEWAARLPLDLISRERPEGTVLHAIADAIEHGELPATGFNVLIEHFRGTEHEAMLAEMTGFLADAEVDDGEMEKVLEDSIDFLQQKALMQEIEQLTAKERAGGLDGDERRHLAALLARKQAARKIKGNHV